MIHQYRIRLNESNGSITAIIGIIDYPLGTNMVELTDLHMDNHGDQSERMEKETRFPRGIPDNVWEYGIHASLGVERK